MELYLSDLSQRIVTIVFPGPNNLPNLIAPAIFTPQLVPKLNPSFSIDDNEALPILYDLIQNEGLSLGTSCGINIAGAIRLGKELGPGKTIVTILCDKSDKYNSKMFNKSFLKEKNLPVPSWI